MKKLQTKQIVKTLNSSPPPIRNSNNENSDNMEHQPVNNVQNNTTNINEEDNSAMLRVYSCPILGNSSEGEQISLLSDTNNNNNNTNREKNKSEKEEVREIFRFRNHTDFVCKIKFFNLRKNLLCSGSNDGVLNIYNFDGTPDLIYSCKAHSFGITEFDLSQDDRLMASSSLDNTVKLWQIDYQINNNSNNNTIRVNLKCLEIFNIGERVNCICFNPVNKNRYCAGDSKGRIHFFSDRSKLPITIQHSSTKFSLFQLPVEDPITSLCYSKNSKYLFVSDSSGLLSIYQQDLQTSRFNLLQRVNQKSSISSLSFADNENLLLVSSCDNKAKLYSIPSLDMTKVFFHSHTTYRLRNSFTANQKAIIVCSEDHNVCIFDIESASLIQSWRAHESVVSCAVSNGERIATASYCGEVAVWDNISLKHTHSTSLPDVNYKQMDF